MLAKRLVPFLWWLLFPGIMAAQFTPNPGPQRVTALPAACSVGQTFFLTVGASAGVFECRSPNVLTATVGLGPNVALVLKSIVISGTKPAINSTGNGSPSSATAIFSITGAAGGDTSFNSASSRGGIGAGFSFVGGIGGDNADVNVGTSAAHKAGSGGFFILTGGAGGNATTATSGARGGAGGSITLTAGGGGETQTNLATPSGAGGAFTLSGGNGGSRSSAGTSGAGGDVTIDAGAAGDASAPAVSGASGAMNIGTANASALNIGNASAPINFAASGFTGLNYRGTTASIGGSQLTVGTCASGTATVTGATSGMPVVATPETYPGDGFSVVAYVSSTNTITVKVCAAALLTPNASIYDVVAIR